MTPALLLSRLAELGPFVTTEAGKRKLDEICEAVKALGLSDGSHVIVPVEPTEAMLKAGMSPFMAAHDPFFSKNEPCGPIYRAMLRSAQETKDA